MSLFWRMDVICCREDDRANTKLRKGVTFTCSNKNEAYRQMKNILKVCKTYGFTVEFKVHNLKGKVNLTVTRVD